jgi:hypothetical protein
MATAEHEAANSVFYVETMLKACQIVGDAV